MRRMCRSIPGRWPRAASGLRTCATRWSRRRSTGPRAISKAHIRPTLSTPTTSCSTRQPISNVIIAYRNGAPVRVKDVGDAIDSVQNARYRRVVFRHQGRGPGDPAPSRRQHNPAGRHDQGDGSAHHGIVPAFDPCRPGVRPLAGHPRGGARRAVHDDGDDQPRDPRYLSVPANIVGDDHPEHRGAAVAAGDVCRHVCGRLQPRQHLADGADDLGRLYRRRRGRHDREHRALHRTWGSGRSTRR